MLGLRMRRQTRVNKETGKEEEVVEETKQRSSVIIVACWNTRVGPSMVSLPWSFQSSGILLGIIVSFTSFVVSFYTCALIIRTSKTDSDYVKTLQRYYGNSGYYFGIICPIFLIFSAIIVYFVVIVQSLYPLSWLSATGCSR